MFRKTTCFSYLNRSINNYKHIYIYIYLLYVASTKAACFFGWANAMENLRTLESTIRGNLQPSQAPCRWFPSPSFCMAQRHLSNPVQSAPIFSTGQIWAVGLTSTGHQHPPYTIRMLVIASLPRSAYQTFWITRMTICVLRPSLSPGTPNSWSFNLG